MDLQQGKRVTAAPAVVISRPGRPMETVEYYRSLLLFAEAPDCLRAARSLVRSTLTDWGLAELVDDVQLAVSELVGNVVHHAVPDKCLTWPGTHRGIDVVLKRWPEWLFVGVSDEDSNPPTCPVVETFSPDLVDGMAEALLPDHGRGLLIVQSLADALWWVPQEEGGKTVYCRFDLDGELRKWPP